MATGKLPRPPLCSVPSPRSAVRLSSPSWAPFPGCLCRDRCCCLWRLAADRRAQACLRCSSTFRFGGGCVQPFCFTPARLQPSGPNLGDGLQYDASLAPPQHGYGAFFVEMRWRGLWDRPVYVFSTPALVVPDTYPFMVRYV